MTAILAVVLALASATAPLGDPLARFSYSPSLAERMNDRLGTGTSFQTDEAQGREQGAPLLLAGIQALIRTFPACGNRQLQFAYAYGQDATAHVLVFDRTSEATSKCPATTVVTLSPSGLVTVRSLPEP